MAIVHQTFLSISVFLYITTITALCTCSCTCTQQGERGSSSMSRAELSHKYLEAGLPYPLQEAFRAVALSKAA